MKWYQISLIQHGDGDAVCVTKPTPPNTKDEVTDIECIFAKGNAGDYFDKPMNALLDYYVDQEKKPGDMDQPTGTVPRIVYVIPKK